MSRHPLPDDLVMIGAKLAATVPMMDKQTRAETVQWALSVAWARGVRSGLKIGLGAVVFLAVLGVGVWWAIKQ